MRRTSAALLALFITVSLLANSAGFLFRQSYLEVWDSAANSLSVIRAKGFAQGYGPYSRWGFYHPGPTLFYVQAFGEWLFHDVLRAVRSPFAGQVVAHAATMGGFFAAALMVFSRWFGSARARWWFLCGALLLAVPHFTAMERVPSFDVLRGLSAFLSPWSAHALVLPFLCLLAAGASVAAGRGEDLPVLALAGGYLIQLHVAEPMFVGPVFVLAYAALVWQQVPGNRPWRVFPRAHLAAGVILLFFAAPMLLDLLRGRDSNFALVWQHARTHDAHKCLERAVFYFLMFGAYTAYNPADNEFAAYDHTGMWAYLRAHAGLYAFWTLVAAACLWALVAGLRRTAAPKDAGTSFRGWAAGTLGLIVLLTLRWNTKQDEQMFYFNSWFTFAVYYFAALLAWATVCDRLPASVPTRLEQTLGVAAVAALALWCAPSLRLADPTPAATEALRGGISRLEAASRHSVPGGAPLPACFLRYEYDTSPTAVAVALQLAREGRPFFTENRWHAYFGDERNWTHASLAAERGVPLQVWRFVHARNHPALSGFHLITLPYLRSFFQAADDLLVQIDDPPLDPNAPDGASIRFSPDGDAAKYAVGGWFTADSGQTWIDDPRALLAFQPVAVPPESAGVDVTLADLATVLEPGTPTAAHQRLRVVFDGEPLGTEAALPAGPATLTFRIPAARWNAAAKGQLRGRLLIELPDAVPAPAPNAFAPKPDKPMIGLGLREVRFQVVP